MTGRRIKRVQKYMGDERFMLTYGDRVSNLNIKDLLAFHKKHGKITTLTATCVEQRFGVLDIDETSAVKSFREKSSDDGSRVNAGYMVLEPEIFQYIKDDNTIFEQEPLEKLSSNGELMAYIFQGYWQCMDTKREMEKLNELWKSGNAPWKSWNE